MGVKILAILLITFNSAFAQHFLFCLYGHIDTIYTCSINIFNPFEQLDFTSINGTHLSGYTDDDVLAVTTGYAASTANIPPIICNKFQNIETLSYRSMGLTIIFEEAFASCKKVTSIDLSNNGIWHVDEKSFDENSELKKLYFMSNELRILPGNVFINSPKLVYLNLEKNNITDLPDGIFKAQENLKELRLNYNKISNLNVEWFENLGKLEILFLSSNLLEELPLGVFDSLTSLNQNWIENNKLEVIHSESFGTLPNLELLNFFGNRIIAIDEKLIDNTGVNMLFMNGNICSTGFMFDNSPGREVMRNYFRECFDKYLELFPGCLIGDLDERVCTLEDENRELWYRTGNLAKEKEELEEKFEDQVKAFNAAIENLQNQINELRNPPTTTNTPTSPTTTTTYLTCSNCRL